MPIKRQQVDTYNYETTRNSNSSSSTGNTSSWWTINNNNNHGGGIGIISKTRLKECIVLGILFGSILDLNFGTKQLRDQMSSITKYALDQNMSYMRRISIIKTKINNDIVASLSSSLISSSLSSPRQQYVNLSNESLAHIQRAGFIDLNYMDVTNNFSLDPHRGALDEYNQPRYVHDVTHLRNNPPPLSWNETTRQIECSKNNISIDAYHYPQLKKLRIASSSSGRQPSKILCAIYTSSQYHKEIDKIRETWGPKCDGFFAASNLTDKTIDTVNVLHEGLEEYRNMWQKVRSIWSYIYDNYYDDYDWFHLGGDDMWLIPDNLRAYVDSDEIQAVSNGGTLPTKPTHVLQQQVPMYLGCRYTDGGNINDAFNTGGPGYTLNRAALKLLVVYGLDNWFQHFRKNNEDVYTARIFNKLNVSVYNTRDEYGSERYMHFPPGRVYHGHAPPFYNRYAGPFNPIRGENHSSVHSIAFHYVKDADEMRRFHATVYGLCPVSN